MWELVEEGDERARLAVDIYAYSVRKYIGAYTAVLDGVDAIVFTGGIGENSIRGRRAICGELSNIGIELDEEANNVRGSEAVISKANSSIPLYVIPTDEELSIARDTYKLSRT